MKTTIEISQTTVVQFRQKFVGELCVVARSEGRHVAPYQNSIDTGWPGSAWPRRLRRMLEASEISL